MKSAVIPAAILFFVGCTSLSITATPSAELLVTAQEVAAAIRSGDVAKLRYLSAYPERAFDRLGALRDSEQIAFFGPRPSTSTLSFVDIARQEPLRFVLDISDGYAWVIFIPERYWIQYEMDKERFLREEFMQKFFVCDFERAETWRIAEEFCFSGTENPFAHQDLAD